MSDWREESFSCLLSEPLMNGVYKERKFHGRGAKVINMGELFAFPRMMALPMKRVALERSEAERFGVKAGDLIFARRSLVAEGAGRCSIIMEVDEDTVFESSIIRARPDSTKSNSLFYYYYFNSPQGLHKLDTIRRQVAVAGITGSDLATLEVPVPDLSEQDAVASTLGILDDKIELNRRMNETLEAVARAIFKDWFVDFGPTRAKVEGRQPYLAPNIWSLFPDRFDDEDKPVDWHIGTLGDLADLNPESWTARSYPDRIEYVDLANTKWGSIEATQACTRASAPSRARRVLRPGDTIVGAVRPGNGSFALVGVDGLTGSTGFAALRPKGTECREVVFLAATSRENIERLAHLADGAAYPAVRPEVVAGTEVAIAPRQVLAAFSRLTAPLADRVIANRQENRTLTETRELLLPRLMSGEIRLYHANGIAADTGCDEVSP